MTMDKTIHLSRRDIPPHLQFGNGQKYTVVITDSVMIPATAGNWDGGSRDTYRVIRLSDGATMPASDNTSAPWDSSRTDRKVELQPGIAVVEHTTFCGKDLGYRFYILPDDTAPLLPAPTSDLSHDESLVLTATRNFKSSYGGKDRYQMMQDDYRWSDKSGAAFPSRADWDAAKQSLITAKLLNKAGAITPAGRNAV